MENLFTLGLVGNVERYGYSPIWRAGLILAQCETDRWTNATDQLVAFAETTGGFRNVAPSGWAVPTLTLLAEACAALDLHGHGHDEVTGLAPLIDGQLAAHKAEIALGGWPTVLVGPVARGWPGRPGRTWPGCGLTGPARCSSGPPGRPGKRRACCWLRRWPRRRG